MLLTRGWEQIFHAGTAMAEGQLVSTGGRVLGVTAMSDDALKAQTLAYQAVDKVILHTCSTCVVHTYILHTMMRSRLRRSRIRLWIRSYYIHVARALYTHTYYIR